MTEEMIKKILESDKKIKGYAFDSLIFRYKMAREAQAEWEAYKYRKEGNLSKADNVKSLAERDVMRFIQILDDVIGEHD